MKSPSLSGKQESGFVQYLVVKIGGRPAAKAEVLDALISDIGALVMDKRPSAGWAPILVHGGGAEVTAWSERLGLQPRFEGGIRQTSKEEMDVVEMVLAGAVNTRILRHFLSAGIPAVGLTGTDAGLFTARSVDEIAGSRTGAIVSVNTGVLTDLCKAGYIPVVSSVSSEPDGRGALNINADDAAMAIAVALRADCLIFLSDIPGILKNGRVLPAVNPQLAEAEIQAGVISGGMIPKVRSSLGAVSEGVGRVVVGGFERNGDLSAFTNGTAGTSIVGS